MPSKLREWESSPLSSPLLEISSQTHPEVFLLSESKSSQVEMKSNHHSEEPELEEMVAGQPATLALGRWGQAGQAGIQGYSLLCNGRWPGW